jgi:ABC-type antimicrobial peptide transport system permease subunit
LLAVRFAALAWAGGTLLGLVTSGLLSRHELPFPIGVPAWGLLVSLGVSGLVGLAAGLGPACYASRFDPAELLKES